jgi:hypothetical protein
VSEDRIVDMVQENFRNLREDLTHRLDRIESKIDQMVTKDDCKKNRQNCIRDTTIRQSELSLKKVTAIGGIITATITASATAVLSILKVFYP